MPTSSLVPVEKARLSTSGHWTGSIAFKDLVWLTAVMNTCESKDVSTMRPFSRCFSAVLFLPECPLESNSEGLFTVVVGFLLLLVGGIQHSSIILHIISRR